MDQRTFRKESEWASSCYIFRMVSFWRIFWKDNLVSNLKLRFSHGEVGNDQIGGDRFCI